MAHNLKKTIRHSALLGLSRSASSAVLCPGLCKAALPGQSLVQRLSNLCWRNAFTRHQVPNAFHPGWITPTRWNLVIFNSCSNWRGSVIVRKSLSLQGRRHYYVDRHGVQHFQMRRPRVLLQGPDGEQARRRMLIMLVIFGGICAWVYVTHLQYVPYSYRRHCILVSPELERKIGEENFKALKQQAKTHILPPIHPLAVRVRKVAKDVIQAVMEGVKTEDWGSEGSHLGRDGIVWREYDLESSSPKELLDKQFPSEGTVFKDEHLDDSWVESSRNKGLKMHVKPFTQHLKGIEWEVIVVDSDMVNALCLPGGKIVVFTGLLKHFPSDEAIAAVLGHEIAHIVARHSVEQLARNFGLTLVELIILMFFYAPDLILTLSTLLLKNPFSRSMELEADRIGLLLMAAAGYDPSVAPAMYEKLWELSGLPEMFQYLETHPSGKTRGDTLKNTAAMDEALHIYREKIAGRVVESFL
eukprot:c26065_g1_i1 orf=380-1789(+)